MNGRRALWWVALGALALRLVLLIARGDYIVYDEGYYLLLERSLRAGHGYALNGLPHVALSPLQPLLVALISMAGVPDLWASRLLAAACGAALIFPVAALARLAGGPRAALPAALFTAVSPALMSFVPFFPGRSWNLYFGSEPLYLLLAFSAVAAALRAERDGWKWWVSASGLAAAAYLVRLEGAVLAGMLLVVLAARLAHRRADVRAWRRLGFAALAGLVVAGPYIGYLRWALGRWAVSGRVQAVSVAGAAPPSAVESARSGGEALDAFVWQGRPEAFVRAMYGLDPAGTRMASQYWGVRRDSGGGAAAAPPAATQPAAADTGRGEPAPMRRGALRVWWQGLTAVVPWWFCAIALAGLAFGARASLVWMIPLATCALLPSAVAYVEPRSLLPLAPLAAIYAGVAAAGLEERLTATWAARATIPLAGVLALGLFVPAARDLGDAWSQRTPLQQVATARRAVGEYLAHHLTTEDIVMSFHPAVAIWADRPWRVLPHDSFERIVAYARREQVAAIVFSSFEPSPIQRPPRAFTVIVPGTGSRQASGRGETVQMLPVDETPLLFVGRLAEPPPSP